MIIKNMSDETPRKRFFPFKKKQNNSEEVQQVFDESSFSFELKSNNYNTSLIEASAVMKKGKHIGMPLPLKCTWYRATDEKEFVTIDGVTGAFYQPNADDIGCKICVHAVPVSEIEEYTGMPAFSEAGPIQIDPELQTIIQETLIKNSALFNIQIMAEKGGNSSKAGTISIDKDVIAITNTEGKVIVSTKITENSPKISINYKSNTCFSLTFDDIKLEIVTEKPAQRDIIVISIRMFCSKASSSSLSEILLKNQQLSSRLFEANRNYEQSLAIINILKDEAAVKTGDLTYYISHYKELEKEYLELKEYHQKTLSQNENINSEIAFLRKDLLVYKEQCSSLENKLENKIAEECKLRMQITNIKEDLESLTKIMICSVCKVDEKLYMLIDRITGNNARNHSSKASSVVSIQEDTFDASDKEKYQEIEFYIIQAKQIRDEFTEYISKAEAEKNFYKRKAESLATENEKLLTKLGKNPKDISEFALEKQLFEENKNLLVKEVEEAKQKIINYEKLIKINKRKLENEIERGFELRKLVQNKGSNSNADYQRIVNSLTQTLSEREEELSKQKSLNKDFMNRIAELETLISTSSTGS